MFKKPVRLINAHAVVKFPRNYNVLDCLEKPKVDYTQAIAKYSRSGNFSRLLYNFLVENSRLIPLLGLTIIFAY
jgi:hypothetical protein